MTTLPSGKGAFKNAAVTSREAKVKSGDSASSQCPSQLWLSYRKSRGFC